MSRSRLRSQARQAVLYALEAYLDGDESIFKEVIESCEDDDDHETLREEVEALVDAIRGLGDDE